MHRRDGQVEVRITIEALCELIRTAPHLNDKWEMSDVEPSHVYYEPKCGIVHIVGKKCGVSGLKKEKVCEGGIRKCVIALITTEDLKKKY